MVFSYVLLVAMSSNRVILTNKCPRGDDKFLKENCHHSHEDVKFLGLGL